MHQRNIFFVITNLAFLPLHFPNAFSWHDDEWIHQRNGKFLCALKKKAGEAREEKSEARRITWKEHKRRNWNSDSFISSNRANKHKSPFMKKTMGIESRWRNDNLWEAPRERKTFLSCYSGINGQPSLVDSRLRPWTTFVIVHPPICVGN